MRLPGATRGAARRWLGAQGVCLALAGCAAREIDVPADAAGGHRDAGPEPAPDASSRAPWPGVPADFPALPTPDDNALTPERVALGKQLFFDTRLSRTGSISCASCHLQQNAFADPERFSIGVDGLVGARNAPALINLAWGTSFFWDGGAPSLELQAIEPIRNPLEMDTTLADSSARLAKDARLVTAFEVAYGQGPSQFTIPRALASFIRTLISGKSPWDDFRRGDPAALSAAQTRGEAIFNGERGECFHCHTGFNLTNEAFRNNGIAPDDPDLGRERLTLRPNDRGKFKVPTLRNVALTAPYMHDGSLPTLEAVIDAYDAGGRGHPNTDPAIGKLDLTPQERADLLEFLNALSDPAFITDPRFAP